MEKIVIFLRTKKTSGNIKLRFRLREGREIDLYHKSDIEADLKDLDKFDESGHVKHRVVSFNRKLKKSIDAEMNLMHNVYNDLCKKFQKKNITGQLFEDAIQKYGEPEIVYESDGPMTLLERFKVFIEDAFRDGIIGEPRMRHYDVIYHELERFLEIKKLTKLTAPEFTADMLMDFRCFLINEYKYVGKYKYLYEDKKKLEIPTQPRSSNTVVAKMKKIQAFFNELEDKEELVVSPFRKLGKQRKASVMKERYDEPIFLHKEEFLKIMQTDVPEILQETKDCFLLQCAFGCRISDFKALTLKKVKVSSEGIPYIHYLPQKTIRENDSHSEIKTPIMLYALKLIKKWNFNFPILKYVSGKSGYNAKIKELLKYCGICRECSSFNASLNDNEYKPLYMYGSSKLCRKTHVDMMNKVQVDMYAAGLHKKGSTAVERYTMLELKDHFTLMCAAFDQPLYKVDKNLNVIE